MFESIKNIFSKKSVNFQSENQGLSTFYPLFNSPRGLKSITRTDYLNLYTGWLYAAVTTIADSVSDLDYHLLAAKKSNREINHKYLKFINSNLLESIASFIKLNGECYIYKEMIGNTIDQLHILRPDLIQIKQDLDGNLEGYIYEIQGKRYLFKEDQLIVFKNFNPFQTFQYHTKGIGDVQAVAVQMETDIATNNWNWNFFKNNASAGDIIEVDDSLDDEVKQRFSSAWNNKFRGVNNSHKLAILDNGMKFVSNSRSQKEMDFVAQRMFTRDEVLGIFKVPKAMIGLGEGVNVGNVKAFEIIFAKRTIKPLATQIMETLNEQLFKGIGYFEFINIVPTDSEELSKQLNDGGITINEYRRAIGKAPIKEGNILKINPFQVSDPVTVEDVSKKEYEKKSLGIGKSINHIISSHIKGTDQYEQKRWEKKILRNNEYEKKYNIQLQKIFKIQREDILKQIKDQKAISKPKWNELKYLTLYHTLIGPLQRDLVEKEGNIAFEEINLDAAFVIGDPATSKWLTKNIDKFAKEIDKTTKEDIFKEIDKGNKEGLGAKVIAANVSSKFDILSTSRAEKIIRTETIRASSFATQKAWEDSQVVSGKQWWTAEDERVCPSCGPMHGIEIDLKSDFFKKGDTAPGGLSLNYSNTPAAPLHPSCRCTLIPIIK